MGVFDKGGERLWVVLRMGRVSGLGRIEKVLLDSCSNIFSTCKKRWIFAEREKQPIFFQLNNSSLVISIIKCSQSNRSVSVPGRCSLKWSSGFPDWTRRPSTSCCWTSWPRMTTDTSSTTGKGRASIVESNSPRLTNKLLRRFVFFFLFVIRNLI